MRRLSLSLLAVVALLLAAGCTTPDSTSSTPSVVPPAPPFTGLATLDYSGNQDALAALDQAIVAAHGDPDKTSALASQLVSLLEQPGATLAGRQAASQRLSSLLSSQSIPIVLARMLVDDSESNLARLALEPVPGPVVDALFVEAIKRTRGPTQIALMYSVGLRRIPAAVPLLSGLAIDRDPATANAAVIALGQIGGPAALAALRATANPTAPNVVTAQLECARNLPTGQAKVVLSQLLDNPRLAPHQRAAAFCMLLPLAPDSAIVRIPAALHGPNTALRAAALGAIPSAGSDELNSLLLAKLGTYDVPIQAAVITALGRSGGAAVVEGISTAVKHPDPAVRIAALEALGRIPGNAETARLLARSAPGNSSEAKQARLSLTRLHGPGVDATLLADAEKGAPGLRVIFIEQLAARNMTEALPLLLRLRSDPDLSVRLAALTALGDFAPFTEQVPILDWACAAVDPEEQSRALRTLLSVTLRNEAIDARVQPVIARLDRSEPAVQLRLLRTLPRLGGSAAAETAGRFALNDNPELAEAAAVALVRWTEAEALEPLVSVAEKSPQEKLRTGAILSAIELMDRNRRLDSAKQTGVITRLLAVPSSPEIRGQLVFLLGRSSDAEALALATSLQSDPVLARAATESALVIRSHSYSPAITAAVSPPDPKLLLDGKRDVPWTVPASAGQWVQIDYGHSRPIRRLTLEQGVRPDLFPDSYAVFVTNDPRQLGDARVTGSGTSGAQTVIDLPPGTQGRYVRIQQTADKRDSSWSMTEILTD